MYIMWKLPKIEYIIGKKPSWLSIKERKVIKYNKEILKTEKEQMSVQRNGIKKTKKK